MIRVLLADDHRMLRESLRGALEDEGFEVVGEADDGEQAVRLTAELIPDVVLMDVSMPTMDGIEATARIRRAGEQVRVVMLTMHNDPDVVTRAVRAGASGYLVKDCSVDEVADTVRRVAGGQTVLSPDLATSMLDEVRRLDAGEAAEAEPLISAREEDVLRLVAEGLSTQEVADALYISQKTVKNHLGSIYQKLDARDRTQAVLRAVRMGIIELR